MPISHGTIGEHSQGSKDKGDNDVQAGIAPRETQDEKECYAPEGRHRRWNSQRQPERMVDGGGAGENGKRKNKADKRQTPRGYKMKRNQSTKKSGKVIKRKKTTAESAFLYQEGGFGDVDHQIIFMGTEKDAIQFFKSQIKLLGRGGTISTDDEEDDGNFVQIWNSNTSDTWSSIRKIRIVRAPKTKI
jgi:hypothetical protein